MRNICYQNYLSKEQILTKNNYIFSISCALKILITVKVGLYIIKRKLYTYNVLTFFRIFYYLVLYVIEILTIIKAVLCDFAVLFVVIIWFCINLLKVEKKEM